MSALPAFPPVKLPDGTVLVASQSADVVRAALVADTVADLREAIANEWYVHGHATKPEYAPSLVDAFAVGIYHLDGARWAAMTFVVEGRADTAAIAYREFIEAALQHAAESLVDMMDDGFRITFGPAQ